MCGRLLGTLISAQARAQSRASTHNDEDWKNAINGTSRTYVIDYLELNRHLYCVTQPGCSVCGYLASKVPVKPQISTRSTMASRASASLRASALTVDAAG